MPRSPPLKTRSRSNRATWRAAYGTTSIQTSPTSTGCTPSHHSAPRTRSRTTTGLHRNAVANITYQLDLFWDHCRNASTGLLVHGYDASKTRVWANPETGASPHVWGRSLGWYALALVDTLELLQTARVHDAVDADVRHGRFEVLAGAIARAADPETGALWQVLDEPGREGNYIESTTFVAALLKGSRLGYLNASAGAAANATIPPSVPYVDVARRAYEYIAETCVMDRGNSTLGWNGTVSVCSLNPTASYEVRRQTRVCAVPKLIST